MRLEVDKRTKTSNIDEYYAVLLLIKIVTTKTNCIMTLEQQVHKLEVKVQKLQKDLLEISKIVVHLGKVEYNRQLELQKDIDFEAKRDELISENGHDLS